MGAYRLSLNDLAIHVIVRRVLDDLKGDLEDTSWPSLHNDQLPQSSLKHGLQLPFSCA